MVYFIMLLIQNNYIFYKKKIHELWIVNFEFTL